MTLALRILVILFCTLAPLPQVFADFRLPRLFTSHMVLQRDRCVPVWGEASPGETISVSIAGQEKTAVAGDDWKWRVDLDPLKAGGPHEMVVRGESTVTIRDILVGEVWICSGQSNMAMSLGQSESFKEDGPSAADSSLRLFKVEETTADAPQFDVRAAWKACTPEVAADFSGVAYYFGRELRQKLGVPVGLIQTSWGGTGAEAWVSRERLETVPTMEPFLEYWDDLVEQYPRRKRDYDAHVAAWRKRHPDGKHPPRWLRLSRGPDHKRRPANLYNAMVAPLLPYAIQGAIWYQGEGNAYLAYQYRDLFPALIMDWRARWGQGAFPFLFVQLPNFKKVEQEPEESQWAELREAQLMTLALPNTSMAVTIDIGEAENIHPRNKRDVGKRLALGAFGKAYDQDLVHSGPIYTEHVLKDGKFRISFDSIGGGLAARGGPLKGFAVAGKDRKFVWAEAEIEGEEVVVSSARVAAPVAVRYAWANNPPCNLYNKEGLPASPFRTDDWPGLTANIFRPR